MPELVFGIDGGNSKTDLVLATSDGEIIARVRGAGTRSHVDGMERTIAAVAALMLEARQAGGVSPDAPVAAAAYFLANLDTPEEEQQAAAAIDSLGLAKQNVVHNDTFAVLHAGAPEGWGVAVVSGAGINATGVDRHGRDARFLALGELSGDWGGGEGVALAALGQAIRAGDGRGPATALRDVIGKPFGLDTPEQVARAVIENRIAKEALHIAAPVVFAAAEAGDAVAVGIVTRLADEIVNMIQSLLTRLDLLDDAVPVVLAGGTLQHGPAMLRARIDELLAGIAPQAATRVLDVPPVAGAVVHALALAGASDAARMAARAALT